MQWLAAKQGRESADTADISLWLPDNSIPVSGSNTAGKTTPADFVGVIVSWAAAVVGLLVMLLIL